MFTTHELEMIPPIQGRERTFGWYPPSHNQYAKVPYKTMAVLDDFKYFHQSEAEECAIKTKSDGKQNIENEGSVLSTKLNSIRQELTKRQIVPNFVRQQCLVKPNNIQEYMKIPLTWKPKYPEPNIDILTADIAVVDISNDKEIEKQSTKENILDIEKSITTKKSLIQRPFTAPGHIIKAVHSSKCSSASYINRQQSSGSSGRVRKPSALLQQRLKQTSISESNLSNIRYENDMQRYKWLMEIPGDPFDIKRIHLPGKQEYCHEVAEVKILPHEPSMQKQNRDTFFYNSMPVQSFSFDISPDFMSERYNKIKNQLRSQGKWNYSSKNFSFVY